MKKAPRRTTKIARRAPTTRPTVAEVDLTAIAHNLKGIRTRVGKSVAIMAVVKANAYGHGLQHVASFVEPTLADYFGVAFPEEGVELRKAGIRKPIQVFTIADQAQASLYAKYGLEATISSTGDVDLLNKEARKSGKIVQVHLKIDTGMNRIGVKAADLETIATSLGKARKLELKGIFTHFATADERNKQFLMHQLDEFRRCVERLKVLGVEAVHVHCANSASILDVPETYFTMVRPGVMMYGYYPSRETTEIIPLRTAMTLKTRVALVKSIAPGESVSYNRRYVATQRTTIATLPIGYADGYTRLLSGKAVALIGGKKCPAVGTICMDQMMVDIGAENVRPGDEAVLIGSQGNGYISARDLAESIGTIPYEICCAISSRVPRTYIQ